VPFRGPWACSSAGSCTHSDGRGRSHHPVVCHVRRPVDALRHRQGYEERFELELERAHRTGLALAIVLGDLDGLKAINDRWGHPAGDTALMEVGRLLDSARRKIDTAARIGGDEFALLLPATDARGAHDFAERLRRRLAGLPAHGGATLTMSFGIVEFPVHGATRETLMHAADEALYRAKQLGRDRSVIDRAAPIEAA